MLSKEDNKKISCSRDMMAEVDFLSAKKSQESPKRDIELSVTNVSFEGIPGRPSPANKVQSNSQLGMQRQIHDLSVENVYIDMIEGKTDKAQRKWEPKKEQP